MKLTIKSSGVAIEGHRGTWYVVSGREYSNQPTIFMLEHEEYGEDAEHLFVTDTGELIYQGQEWNDLEEHLETGQADELSIDLHLYLNQKDLLTNLGEFGLDLDDLAFQLVQELLRERFPNSSFQIHETETQSI